MIRGGEAGSKLVRLLSFVGAAVVCTAAINQWRNLERKAAYRAAGIPEEENSSTTTKLVKSAAES
ncbi:hypothetical protein ACLOJK_008777 [Asimina triloba]